MTNDVEVVVVPLSRDLHDKLFLLRDLLQEEKGEGLQSLPSLIDELLQDVVGVWIEDTQDRINEVNQ